MPGLPPPGTPRTRTPRRTPSRTPIRKRITKNVEMKESVPSIDGYTIHPDDEDVKTSASRISLMGCIHGFGNWYTAKLESHPVPTKSLTAGSLAVVGDVLAQIIEFRSDLRDSDILFDRRRIFAMFIEGSCVSGPMLHFVFEFYEYIMPIHCIEECVHKDQENMSMDNELSVGDVDISGAMYDHEYEVSKRQYLTALLHVAFDQIVMAFPYVAG
jgi:hypothetical protein